MSCSGSPEEPHEQTLTEPAETDRLREYALTPRYGPVKAISGKAMFGQETSIIGLCSDRREKCTLPVNIDGSEEACWLAFTKESSADIERLHGQAYVENGEYWIEGEGRVAARPGGFGHLGAYTCQVEIKSVVTFEIGPPYFWEPPPPT